MKPFFAKSDRLYYMLACANFLLISTFLGESKERESQKFVLLLAAGFGRTQNISTILVSQPVSQ